MEVELNSIKYWTNSLIQLYKDNDLIYYAKRLNSPMTAKSASFLSILSPVLTASSAFCTSVSSIAVSGTGLLPHPELGGHVARRVHLLAAPHLPLGADLVVHPGLGQGLVRLRGGDPGGLLVSEVARLLDHLDKLHHALLGHPPLCNMFCFGRMVSNSKNNL